MTVVRPTTVEPSPFDSGHYGRRVGRLDLGTDAPDRAILAAREAGYEVLFARAAAEDPARRYLEQRGLPVLDTLVTSTLSPTAPAAEAGLDVEVRASAVITDAALLEAIEALTARSITRSHLHADPRLPSAQTQALFSAWARNDASGRAARTFTAWLGGEFVGYLAALATPDASVVDLVAVEAAARGRGVGTALLDAFVGWARTRPPPATVGTQADNPALRLYARRGFVPTRTDLTYHLWLVDP
ncbi:MAG: GNAT family N-acetyltransferase [Kofleriaceae bacterium]